MASNQRSLNFNFEFDSQDFDSNRPMLPDLIEEHLFLGDESAAESAEILRALDIKYVLSVFNGEVINKVHSVTYKKIDVDDYVTEELITHFPEANEFILGAQKAGHNVLVHCGMGISRSGTVVIAYLMNKYRMPYKEARQKVVDRRSCVRPNLGFAQQLEIYEEMNFTLNANNIRLRRLLVDTLLSSDTFWSAKVTNRIDQYFEKRDFIEGLTKDMDFGRPCLCVQCGAQLFHEVHIIKNLNVSLAETNDPKRSCHFTYIEPQKWMTSLMTEFAKMELQVKCPECDQLLIELKKRFTNFLCGCALHDGIAPTLRFRLANIRFKIQN